MSNRTLFTLLDETARKYGNAVAMYQPSGHGKYDEYSWRQYRDIAVEVACGLRSLGVKRGEIVALHSEARAEFYLADLGIMANGSIAAALYSSMPPEELVTTLANCDPAAAFVEEPKMLRALWTAGAPKNGLRWILLTGSEEGALCFDKLRARGRAEIAADPDYFERLHAEVRPEDHAILYLTSGATGTPKMGLTTHQAVIANCNMGPVALPLTHEDVSLVFLPAAHMAQRIVVEMLPILSGTAVYFSEGLAKMPYEFKTIRPTFLLAPPRVWERVQASVQVEVRKQSGIAQQLFYGAVGLGIKAAELRSQNRPLPGWMSALLKIADKRIFEKIRMRLGGRLRIAISGAAPLSKDLAKFYQAIGLPLIEGYGLTESGVVVFNPLDHPRPGSIGTALPGVEVKLLDDGELLLKTPGAFTGYYKDPQATAAVLQDGWLHTGDVAEMDADGYLYITGRKKELIVSSNGKKIYPSRIENIFKTEPLISQVVLAGDRQPYVVALFTLNTAAAESMKGMGDLKGKPPEELAAAAAVVEEVGRAVKRANKQLAPFEQIKRFRILDKDFSIDSGELTPTMKVRRSRVLQNYKQTISELYLGREEMN